MYATLAGEAVPGPLKSTQRQGDTEGGDTLRRFLEQSRDETLRHVFDQVRITDGLQIQPNVALSHPSFSIYYGIGYIEWHRMLKLKKKQQGDWYQKKRGPLRKNWHGLHRVFGEVHTRIALCFNPGGLLLMVPGSQSST